MGGCVTKKDESKADGTTRKHSRKHTSPKKNSTTKQQPLEVPFDLQQTQAPPKPGLLGCSQPNKRIVFDNDGVIIHQ